MAERQQLTRRRVLRAGGAAAAGVALATGSSARPAGAGGSAGSLVGTWMVTNTRAGSIPNGILATVLPDGSFLRTGNTHPVEGPGHGVWQQVGEGVYDVTYLALQFDPARAFIGHRKSWLRLTLDPSGDSFTGLARVVTIDPSGAEGTPAEAEIRGARMVAEPFA